MVMSGDSSNVSRGLLGSASSRPASRRVLGVPKYCWCGERMITLMSKSEHNPYRRYFRCEYAVSEKIWGDEHAFKWVDEGLADEIDMLKVRNEELEQELKALKLECIEGLTRLESEMKEKVEQKVESEVMEKVQGLLSEAHCGMKRFVVQVVVGCVVLVVCTRLLD